MKQRQRIFLTGDRGRPVWGVFGDVRAADPPARLALYVNGVLQGCIEGVARRVDRSYREDRSEPHTSWELKPTGSQELGACPARIPRALPLPAGVSALEGDKKSFGSENERRVWQTFIFVSGEKNPH
jgi:hypothetical protein